MLKWKSLSRVQFFVTPWTGPWNSPGQNTGVGSLSLLWGIFPTQGSNPGLPHYRWRQYQLQIKYFWMISESVLHIRCPKYWSLNFSISPSNEYSGLISFRMDWLDLLAVQGTLKSLLQYYSSKASIFRHSAFFIVQLSHPYMTIDKAIALTIWTLVGKVMSLFFNMLSKFIIAFLPRNKCLSISWLQSPSAVILEPKKIKSVTVSFVSLSICHEVMGLDAMILVFLNVEF